jgi:putative sterol carrier protein
MADATTEFMHALGRRGHDPFLRRVNETVRFDLGNGDRTDRWLVRIENGDVTVSHKGGAADTVIHADRELFERMARGEANPVAAVLRGDARLEGEVKSMVAVKRLFTGLQVTSDAQPSAVEGRKR